VHAYVTAWADTNALSLDLHVHNGFDGHDKTTSADDPLGKVYFRSLELWLPKGWIAQQEVTDKASGTSSLQGGWEKLPLIARRGDGKMHVMPHQAHLQRRLAISRKTDAGEARQVVGDDGLGFCQRGRNASGDELWSWWNTRTARYFPQKHALPDLSFLDYNALEAELSGTYLMARTALETGNPGNYAVPSAALGWAHPWGIPYGGMTGGIEINLYDGVQLAEVGTHEGWLGMRLTQRMTVDRQPFALYGVDGEPTFLEEWVQPSPFPHIDMNFWMSLLSGDDPFGFWKAPVFQIQEVQNSGLVPGYESGLLGYEPYDFQHYVRFTRTLKAMAWPGNDALAKDQLRLAAEIVRMSMHDYPNSSGKYHSGAALFGYEDYLKHHPHNGLSWDRGQAWSLDTVVAAYATGDERYRARVRPWLGECADIVTQGQVACSGFIMAEAVPGWLNGNYRMRSQPEHTIIEHSLWGLRESVLRGVDPARDDQMRRVIAAASGTVIGPISWTAKFQGPWYIAATAPLDPTKTAYCSVPAPDAVGAGIETFFSWASFGYGWELSHDPDFLVKAARMSGGSDALSGLIHSLQKGTANIETTAAVLAAWQNK